ncbi:unnamed protein product [Paramecium primaurelia]|uniref:Uncharacterized protein n=1 Tax=Paramecium primaurelia TaxID=5886 RepID=A0A8S1MG07_PARPR|nr:unnamed protein product [Paramecium primaurelia]
MKIKKQKALRSKYKSINSSERALIINYIEEYKYSTAHVSMITGHNASTIKAIYQVYKKQGRINKKVKRDKILNLKFQFMLFVYDDPKGNLTKINVEQHEYQKQIVEDQHMNQSNSQEQAIKRILECNQIKIMNLLDNANAIDTFKQEMKIIQSQELPSQQFSSLQLIPCFNIKENNQTKFLMKYNLKFISNLFSQKQDDTKEDEESKLSVEKKLNEQYRLMRM